MFIILKAGVTRLGLFDEFCLSYYNKSVVKKDIIGVVYEK